MIFPATVNHPLELLASGGSPDKDRLLSPTLPNRFIAEVPARDASRIAAECEKSCRDAWRRICDQVRMATG